MADSPILASLLRFDPERGRIRLKDYRMVMLSAAALGCLRKELIETVGQDEARAVLKRFGHAAGAADHEALRQRFPQATRDEHLAYGPALHSLEGAARVTIDREKSEVDLDQGRYRVEARWENSYEAEQHLELFGRSESPVCWTLVGYATGHSTAAAGRETVVVETECKAMGNEHCRFVVGFADDMPEEAKRENPDYAPQRLKETMDRLLGTIRTQKRTLTRLRSEIDSPGGLIGTSPAVREALELAHVVAPVDTTVLILGESGTGKELYARLLHDESSRSGGPFVAINCSALPENLQEAELFGFAKGSFTGAANDSRGLFEAADGGTLFLDEVGDLSLSAQTKILRALQEGEIKRIGETTVRKVNVRVLAATHRDLTAMMKTRAFRDDLYYRLSVVTVTLPPLRDRGDDTLLLARHFATRYAKQFDKPVRGLSRAAKCALAAYPWPGNVRELQNAVQRGVILSQGKEVELEDLPEAVWKRPRPRTAPPRPRELPTLDDIPDEGERIARALELADGNRERAAAILGISRTTLWRRLRKHGVTT